MIVYLNEITIISKNKSDHIHDLKQIFKWCKKYGMSLNPKKSFLAPPKGKLLGFIVSKDGIIIDPNRVKTIS